MNRFLRTTLWCAMVAGSLSLVTGCKPQTSTDDDFEKQIRAPKGPPPPEAVKAMNDIKAAEQKDKASGKN